MKAFSLKILFSCFLLLGAVGLCNFTYMDTEAMVNDMFNEEQEQQQESTETDQEEAVMEGTSTNFIGSLIRLLLALAAVIAIIIVIA